MTDRKNKPTGAGSEATEGMHGADGDRAESDNTALDGKETGRDGNAAGSEPLKSHDKEHKSTYGGGGTAQP